MQNIEIARQKQEAALRVAREKYLEEKRLVEFTLCFFFCFKIQATEYSLYLKNVERRTRSQRAIRRLGTPQARSWLQE